MNILQNVHVFAATCNACAGGATAMVVAGTRQGADAG